MKEIKIPKEIQGCTTAELLQKFMLSQVHSERLTPGIRESLQEADDFFIKRLDEIAKENKTEAFFQEKEWVLRVSHGHDYAMPAGHYVKIDGVIHLVIPSFEK